MWLHPFYLILGFAVGLFLAYFIRPETQRIIKFPTPENAGNIVYKDSAGVCYVYRSKNVECPRDTTQIRQIPLQHYIEKKSNSLLGILGLKS